MKIALYARVSTSDKDQYPLTQLLPLRDFCSAQGWEVYEEYVDQAPANDLAHRTQWRQLLDDAAKRKFSVVLVFKLDRAFRSVKQMHGTLAAWELVGVSFKSLREQFDTSTALGRLLLNLLASLAEFELELIRERVKAGMDRARRQGKKFGRPKVTDRKGFSKGFGAS
jgi:DNA invertase Pin-like site-specific DNA recombinase